MEKNSKEENHNVQGIPHTESQSSGPSRSPHVREQQAGDVWCLCTAVKVLFYCLTGGCVRMSSFMPDTHHNTDVCGNRVCLAVTLSDSATFDGDILLISVRKIIIN